MIGRLSILAVSLTASFAAMARAQDHPVLLPTRDVAVIYRLPGDDTGNSAQKLQATFADHGNRDSVRLLSFHGSEVSRSPPGFTTGLPNA